MKYGLRSTHACTLISTESIRSHCLHHVSTCINVRMLVQMKNVAGDVRILQQRLRREWVGDRKIQNLFFLSGDRVFGGGE